MRDEVIYSDFSAAFNRSPVTSTLTRITNERAIRESIRNLLMIIRGEVPYHSSLGSNIRSALFEPANALMADMLREVIAIALERDPRLSRVDVSVTPLPNQDGYDVSVRYSIQNINQVFNYTTILKRIR